MRIGTAVPGRKEELVNVCTLCNGRSSFHDGSILDDSRFKNVRDHPDYEEMIMDLDCPARTSRTSSGHGDTLSLGSIVTNAKNSVEATTAKRAAVGYELKGLWDHCALGPSLPWSGDGECRTGTGKCFSQNLHSIVIQSRSAVGVSPIYYPLWSTERCPSQHDGTRGKKGWIRSASLRSPPL